MAGFRSGDRRTVATAAQAGRPASAALQLGVNEGVERWPCGSIEQIAKELAARGHRATA